MNTNLNQESVNRTVLYALNDMGYNFMVIYEPDGHLSYVNVTSFVPSASSSVESTDFMTVTGIDFNEFFFGNTSVNFLDNTASLRNALASYLTKHSGRTRKYSKNIDWVMYMGAGN